MENKKFIVKLLGTVSPYCKGERNCPLWESKILLDGGNGITS